MNPDEKRNATAAFAVATLELARALARVYRCTNRNALAMIVASTAGVVSDELHSELAADVFEACAQLARAGPDRSARTDASDALDRAVVAYALAFTPAPERPS